MIRLPAGMAGGPVTANCAEMFSDSTTGMPKNVPAVPPLMDRPGNSGWPSGFSSIAIASACVSVMIQTAPLSDRLAWMKLAISACTSARR